MPCSNRGRSAVLTPCARGSRDAIHGGVARRRNMLTQKVSTLTAKAEADELEYGPLRDQVGPHAWPDARHLYRLPFPTYKFVLCTVSGASRLSQIDLL